MQGNSKIYTTSQPSEFAAEFQSCATPSHVKVNSHLHHNWSLGERVPHGSGVAAIYHATFYHSYPIPRCNSQSAIGQGHNIMQGGRRQTMIDDL